EVGRLLVNRPALLDLDRALLVDRVAEEVEDATERRLAHGDRDRPAGVRDLGPADEAVRRPERDRADAVAAQVLLGLAGELEGLALDRRVDGERVVEVGEVALLELGVERRADDLDDGALLRGGRSGLGSHGKSPAGIS